MANLLKRGNKVTISGQLSIEEWTNPTTGEIVSVNKINWPSVLDYHLEQNVVAEEKKLVAVTTRPATKSTSRKKVTT